MCQPPNRLVGGRRLGRVRHLAADVPVVVAVKRDRLRRREGARRRVVVVRKAAVPLVRRRRVVGPRTVRRRQPRRHLRPLEEAARIRRQRHAEALDVGRRARHQLEQVHLGRAAPLVASEARRRRRHLARRHALRRAAAVHCARRRPRARVVRNRPEAAAHARRIQVAREVAERPHGGPQPGVARRAGQPVAHLEVAALEAQPVPRRELAADEARARHRAALARDLQRPVLDAQVGRRHVRLAVRVRVDPVGRRPRLRVGVRRRWGCGCVERAGGRVDGKLLGEDELERRVVQSF